MKFKQDKIKACGNGINNFWTNPVRGVALDSDSFLTAVIFDCDGILVDSEPIHYQAFLEVLAPLGLEHDYDHYVKHYIGFDDRDAFVEIFKEANRPLDAKKLAELINAKETAMKRIISRGLSSFPGVKELVSELSESKIPLAIASGSFRHEVLWFLDALQLTGAFPIIAAADDVERSKPDPETYLVALERLRESTGGNHIEPRRCIAIEDTPTGIQAAKAAGLFVVAITNSFAPDELSEADRIFKSLTELNLDKLVKLLKRSVC